jgi:multiple sugar transport system permease protein
VPSTRLEEARGEGIKPRLKRARDQSRRSGLHEGKLRRFRQRIGIPYMFLSPFLLLFALFLIVPLVYALQLSLFQQRLVGGNVFVGLHNYLAAFTDSNFLDGIRRMALFGVVQIPVMIGLALAFALLLDGGLVWLRRTFRMAFFLPYAVPSVVAALMWGYLYGPSFGPLSEIGHNLHVPVPAFLSPSWMLVSIGNVVTWEYAGYNMIILFAALQAVPSELREAAAVDGASQWVIARRIKVPLIKPALLLTIVFSIIGTLQLFNEPQIMFSIAPTVIGNHYTPNLYAYTLAFTNQQYNYSAAISFTLGAVVFIGSYTFMLVTNRGRGL